MSRIRTTNTSFLVNSLGMVGVDETEFLDRTIKDKLRCLNTGDISGSLFSISGLMGPPV